MKTNDIGEIQYAVITEIPKDITWNLAVSEILISPKHKKKNPHLAGAGIIARPDHYSQKLFTKMIRRRVEMLGKEETTIDLTKEQLILCLSPVFELGEILIVDKRTDRTIPDGRKPSKWDVGCEYFDTIEEAIRRAREVMA